MTNKEDLTKLIRTPTAEEIEKSFKAAYIRNLETPENFSKWFPDLSEAIDKAGTELLYPDSRFVTIAYEWIKWLSSDNYSESKIREFSEYLINVTDLKEGKKYFVKTGVFSDKFNYSKRCELSDIKNVGKQFLDMYYNSMMVGANVTNEVVVREYIESTIKEKIYNGMPLRTEFRVFADIKGEDSNVIDVVNYWHPKLMSKYLSFEDSITYKKAESRLIEEFEKHKEYVSNSVLEVVKNIDSEVLRDKWSIDVMLEGDKFYVIDCARMDRSALVEFVK